MALALPGAIASSDVADAALVDLGTLAQCDAQQTLCPDDSWEPRDQMGIVAKNGQLSGRPFFLGTAQRWSRLSGRRDQSTHVLGPPICPAVEQSPRGFLRAVSIRCLDRAAPFLEPRGSAKGWSWAR